jgi:hypothetical protein
MLFFSDIEGKYLLCQLLISYAFNKVDKKIFVKSEIFVIEMFNEKQISLVYLYIIEIEKEKLD